MKPSCSLPFILLVVSVCFSKALEPLQVSEPHPHQGVIKPVAGGDPGITLDADALKMLQAGNPYQTLTQSGRSGRGLVVQDIKAPVDVVWEHILDFDYYSQMVPKTAESETYKTEDLGDGRKRFWVRMMIGFPMLKIQFFTSHLYDPVRNSLIWTLDYTRKSDLDDSVGFWYVIPHPDNPNRWTRLYYSVDVLIFPWMPQFVVDYLSNKALTDATAWVKKCSELEASTFSPSKLVAIDQPKTGLEASLDQLSSNQTKILTVKQNDTCIEGNDGSEKVTKAPTEKIGLTRYALLSTAVVLALYNIHLYLSQ